MRVTTEPTAPACEGWLLHDGQSRPVSFGARPAIKLRDGRIFGEGQSRPRNILWNWEQAGPNRSRAREIIAFIPEKSKKPSLLMAVPGLWSAENEYADQSADVMIALDRDDLGLTEEQQAAIMEVIEPIIRCIWDTALKIGAGEPIE